MSRIKVLDCTLRDGGYCNQWNFGENNIKKIADGLENANVDIIELGFLTNKVIYNKDVSMYTSMDEVAKLIPNNRNGKIFVCMMNYGEYMLDDIPEYDGSSLEGVRIAFHKKDMVQALEFCQEIQKKGYKVFVQAMVTLNYSDREFINLIQSVNEFNPYAFYIVDSFGVMKKKDLIRLFYMVEHNLLSDISIGYHSHNNMQLAYSNSQSLVDIRTNRDVIFDSSIFGMGRGAGNLNTELFVEYLNDNIGADYRLKPLLTIIDEILNAFYQQNYWGYSLPNYLSAKHNAHPNYASFLDSKMTLTVENIDEIFAMMDDEKKSSYDKNYIEKLYVKYMTSGEISSNHLIELKSTIEGKDILIIAPGRSSIEEKNKIVDCSKKKDVITISINFEYKDCRIDYIFLSNLRRYRELDAEKRSKCIVTSNIPADDVFLQTNYQDLLNQYESVEDNAGMMLIKYLIDLGANKIYIAGLDGYSIDPTKNFADQKMNFYTKKTNFEAMNAGMNATLLAFKEKIEIEYITTPKYVYV